MSDEQIAHIAEHQCYNNTVGRPSHRMHWLDGHLANYCERCGTQIYDADGAKLLGTPLQWEKSPAQLQAEALTIAKAQLLHSIRLTNSALENVNNTLALIDLSALTSIGETHD